MNIINSILWAIATVFLVTMGIYFTFKLKGIQFKFAEMGKSLFKKGAGSVSPFASLMMVLGGRIGVGSIAGVALAIHFGGMGSIFWMWIIGFLSIPLAFAETVLAVKYKEKDGDCCKGGPSYYLKNAMNSPKLGGFYAILILFSYVGGFLGIQSNTITKSLQTFIDINPLIVGLIISFLTFIIIVGGVKKIAGTCTKLVPFMTIVYVFSAIYILIVNIDLIPNILLSIVKNALNFKSLTGGAIGSLIIGIQRGIFSSEAGLGTGAIAAATVDTEDSTSQGFVQMIGIYVTTFLICTSTAVIILTANLPSLYNDINGIEITQSAFVYHLGNIGNIIVFGSIILFAFSTILSGYYDSEISLKYFLGSNCKDGLSILKSISLIVIFLGSIVSSSFLWSLVDILTALLAIINVYALFVLRDEVLLELRKYPRYDKIK